MPLLPRCAVPIAFPILLLLLLLLLSLRRDLNDHAAAVVAVAAYSFRPDSSSLLPHTKKRVRFCSGREAVIVAGQFCPRSPHSSSSALSVSPGSLPSATTAASSTTTKRNRKPKAASKSKRGRQRQRPASRREQQWDSNFALLEDYRRTHGHSNPPRTCEIVVTGGSGGDREGEETEEKTVTVRLGLWLDRQRRSFHDGKLGPDRAARLETAGVVWSPSDRNWEDLFAHLVDFRDREGHCDVPARYRTPSNPPKPLGAWHFLPSMSSKAFRPDDRKQIVIGIMFVS